MGAPIYLVSACTSGEEFIAAFRRYADKNGLFIPIGEPLPAGCRSRFAITLRDGGVMIEGEAEIVSSARSPSVLHGRVGMTLRFVTPDDASKITLGELERARLAMKPPPPSTPPRPAEIPAEPRPVPPPIQGRIDAVNALAECVAIGDTAALGPPLAPLPAPPPKAGPRFVAPIPAPPARSGTGTSPPGSLSSTPPAGIGTTPPVNAGASSSGSVGTSPPGGLGTLRPSALRAATSPLSMVMPRATDGPEPARDTAAVPPRGTPRVDSIRSGDGRPGPDGASGLSQTLTAATPGPISETLVAAAPPAPAVSVPPSPTSTPAASGPIPRAPVATPSPRPAVPAIPRVTSSAMTARPATPPSAVPSVPSRTTTRPGAAAPTERLAPGANASPLASATAPSALSPSAPPHVGAVVVAATHDDVSGRTQIHAGVPAPPMTTAASSGLPASPVTVHGMPTVLRPPAQPMLGDVEIAEPTDISLPPGPPGALPIDTIEQIITDPEPSAGDRRAGSVRNAGPARSGPFARLPDRDPDGDASQRTRNTVIGMAITPSGAPVLPARPAPAKSDASLVAPGEFIESIGRDRAIVADRRVDAVDPVGPTLPPDARHAAAIDEPTPIVGWMVPDVAASPPSPPPATHPGAAHGLPNGDWTIALDPAAPDGWTAPKPPPAPVAAPGGSSRGSGSHGAIADGHNGAALHPHRPAQLPSELPASEPKVQVDPTLIEIEPLPSAPPDSLVPGPPGFPPSIAPAQVMYGAPPVLGGTVPPFPVHTMPPAPAFAAAQGGPPHPGHGDYPMDPAYRGMAVLQPVELMPPHAAFGHPRYPAGAMRATQRRRRLIIVLASALVAVLLGIAGLLVMRTRSGATQIARSPTTHDPAPAASEPRPSAKQTSAADPGPSRTASSSTTASPAPGGAVPSAAPGASPSTAETGGAAPPPAEPSAGPAPDPAPAPVVAPPRNCFADVRSQPSGAEIFVAKSRVPGTTPKRIALPCGAPVDLVIRKARLAPVTRTITPTPEPTLVEVSLTRQTFLVKVSSTPSGATITLGGKALGVTPTIVRVPAYEASILSISKDGYELDTERVAPRSNGLAVHTVLKRSDRKKAR